MDISAALSVSLNFAARFPGFLVHLFRFDFFLVLNPPSLPADCSCFRRPVGADAGGEYHIERISSPCPCPVSQTVTRFPLSSDRRSVGRCWGAAGSDCWEFGARMERSWTLIKGTPRGLVPEFAVWLSLASDVRRGWCHILWTVKGFGP